MMENYFAYYELPEKLQLDTKQVKKKFLDKSRSFHPDRHVLSETTEQATAMEETLKNNMAFKVLADPYQRLFHLLQLKGIIKDSEQGNTLPQSFLMEMMDVNEQLMELEMEPDEKKIEMLQKEIKALITTENELTEALCETYDANQNVEILQKLKDQYFKRKYMLRIQNNLDKFAEP